MIKYILCVVYILFSVSGLTLVKMGSNSANSKTIVVPVIGVSLTLLTILGILCYGISFLLYLGVVSKFDLGLIIPILGGIVNILILVASYFVLKEQLTLNMIIGAVIIIVGIFIMNIKRA